MTDTNDHKLNCLARHYLDTYGTNYTAMRASMHKYRDRNGEEAFKDLQHRMRLEQNKRDLELKTKLYSEGKA